MTTAWPVAMRQALQATAAASSVSVTGARGTRGHDAGLAQQLAAQVASGLGVLAVKRRARHRAERQLRMHLVQRMPAGLAVPVGLEQLRPQPPGLDAEPWPVGSRQRWFAAW